MAARPRQPKANKPIKQIKAGKPPTVLNPPRKRAPGAGRPAAVMAELGKPGLRRSFGFIDEEWLPKLRTRQLRIRAYKTMMGTDATVAAVGNGAKMAIKQVDFFIQPAGTLDGDVAFAAFVEDCIFNSLDRSWPEKLTEILSYPDYGFGLFEMVWERRPDGKIGWKKWGFRPQESVYQWVFDPTSLELTGFQQQVFLPASQNIFIPIEKCIHFTHNSMKGNPEGESWWRGVYMAWYAKHKLELIELIGIERNVAGLPDVKIPSENFLKKNKKTLQMYQDIADNVRRNEDANFVTPSDVWPGTSVQMYSIGLTGGQQLTTRGTGLPTIQPINRYQGEIARGLQADFMLLPSGGPGSYALSSNKSSFFVMFVASICDHIAETINTQAIAQLAEFNDGSFGEISGLPKMVHGNVAETEVADIGQLMANLVKASAAIFPNDELLNAILDRAGLPHVDTSANVKQAEKDKADMAAATAATPEQAAWVEGPTTNETAEDLTAPPQGSQPPTRNLMLTSKPSADNADDAPPAKKPKRKRGGQLNAK